MSLTLSAIAEFVAIILAVLSLPIVFALYLWLDFRERHR